MDLTLYFAPGACSRVPLIALEETGHSFETKLVAFMKGDHKSPEFLALNPAGKIPLLVADGRPLSQNVAILTYLAKVFPEAGLLPLVGDPFEDAAVLGKLLWCSADLHPIVTRIRLPQFFCDIPDAVPRIKAAAEAAIRPHLATADSILGTQPWMLGEQWSVIDAYIHWIWYRVTGAGFDGAEFANIAAFAACMETRPAVRRALAREAEAEADLEARGLSLKLTPSANR